MKTKMFISMLFLFVILFLATIYSCQKRDSGELKTPKTTSQSITTVDDQINFYYQEFLKSHQSQDNNIWQKIKAWFIAHSGTHLFNGCNLPYNCGPCPGICLSIDKSTNSTPDADFTHVADNYLLSQQEWDGGGREIQLTLYNDTIMQISFIHGDLTARDTLYVPTDFSIGSSAAQVFEMSSIIVKEGHYPLTYSQLSNGSTIVNVICAANKK